MAFKVKDLMINYLPAQVQNPQPPPPCAPNSPCTSPCSAGGCSFCTNCTHCTHCTVCTACTHCTHCTHCTVCTACTHCSNHCTFITPIQCVPTIIGCGASICETPSNCGILSNPCICTVLASIVNPQAADPTESLNRLSALKQQLTAQLAQIESRRMGIPRGHRKLVLRLRRPSLRHAESLHAYGREDMVAPGATSGAGRGGDATGRRGRYARVSCAAPGESL